jgi:hypothetical protein
VGTYRINEGSLELPDGYVDQTINVFPNSSASPADFSIVVSRDTPLAGENLQGYFERQMKQLPNSLPGLKVVRRAQITVGDQPAFEVEYTWVSKGMKMHQRQATLMVGGRILNVTASALDNSFHKFAAQFDEILSSFKFES